MKSTSVAASGAASGGTIPSPCTIASLRFASILVNSVPCSAIWFSESCMTFLLFSSFICPITAPSFRSIDAWESLLNIALSCSL